MTPRASLAAPLAVATLLFAGSASACPSAAHVATDQELNDLLDGLAVVAEGPSQQEQYDWSSGVVEPFTLTYDSGTNTATYSLGGKALQYQPLLGFKEMFIRCRAVNTNTTITVNNLVLNGCAVADHSSADGNGSGLDILALTGEELDAGFTLTGDATLTWQGSPPTQSRLAFQIKVGNAPTVSVEPSTWSRMKRGYRD